jgi:hypothetical protein
MDKNEYNQRKAKEEKNPHLLDCGQKSNQLADRQCG